MIYMITGHLGSGKTLLAVSLAQQYMQTGRRVATNLTLNPEYLVKSTDRQIVAKLPGVPTEEFLNNIGRGYEGKYDEEKFGLLLLDEAGTWLNSRDWSDKSRRGLFRWITHARKFGWDVALIVQDWESLDAQIRRSVCECFVSCSRLDRMKVPFIPIKLPRVHMATARYQGPNGPVMKRWFTRGSELFDAYDTNEKVSEDLMYTDQGPIDVRANSSILSAWHVRGRYLPPPLSLNDRVWVLVGLAIVAVLGSILAGLAGRSPAEPVKAAWARFRATREPSPLLAIKPAHQAAA